MGVDGEIILHHYDRSPFSEKVRRVLGIKGLRWHSVVIPSIMPKPLYTPLTGGYRRTPSLQIGADVWCDSAAAIRELERRFPKPTLHPAEDKGLAWALGAWADRSFFHAAVNLVFGTIGDQVSQAFLDDRAELTGTAFDVARMRASVPVMREQIRAHAALIEDQLADGRPFLSGEAPGLADVQASFVPWFIRSACPQEAGVFDALPRMGVWERRTAAIGHGGRVEMDANRALAIAREAIPDALPDTDAGEPNRLAPGMQVEVAPDDYGRDFVRGELVSSSPHEIALLRHPAGLGEIVVHFPRAGFVVYRR